MLVIGQKRRILRQPGASLRQPSLHSLVASTGPPGVEERRTVRHEDLKRVISNGISAKRTDGLSMHGRTGGVADRNSAAAGPTGRWLVIILWMLPGTHAGEGPVHHHHERRDICDAMQQGHVTPYAAPHHCVTTTSFCPLAGATRSVLGSQDLRLRYGVPHARSCGYGRAACNSIWLPPRSTVSEILGRQHVRPTISRWPIKRREN
jgi:hypothetical protein